MSNNVFGSMRRRFLQTLPTWAGALVAAGAGIVLVGWIFDLERLKDWPGNGITMKANAAIAMLAAGIALSRLGTNSRSRLWIRVLAAVPIAIGLLTLLEHACKWNLGIDTLLFTEPPGAKITVAPGRIGPPASFACLSLGLGLMFATERSRPVRSAAVWCALLPLAMALISIAGYFFGADELYGIAQVTGISLQMSIIIATAAAGLVTSLPDLQPMRIITADTGAGLLVRRALPTIILIPFAIGWLRTKGEEAGWFDSGMGQAVVVIVLIILFSALLAWTATIIDARERALRTSEEAFAKAFRASPDALLITTLEDGRVHQTNKGFLDLTGLTQEDVVGRCAQELGIYVDPEEHARSLDELHARGRLRNHEIKLRTAAGQVLNVTCSAEPIVIGDRQFLLTIMRDVTELRNNQQALRENEERLRRVNEELERRVAERTSELLEANEQLNGFTYSVAHDLRQSIRGMVINAQIVQQDYLELLDSEARDLLARIVTSGKKMSDLVDDLLKYARVSKQEPRRRPVDVSQLARMVGESVRSRYPGAHVLVEEGLVADADPGLLQLLFENLIDNSCKYVRFGRHATVEVGASDDTFFVRDDGIGFDPKYAERIFQPFERLEVAKYEGTGIGLANVRRVVTKHGGVVWAESKPGRGTTIYFTLSPRTTDAPMTPNPDAMQSLRALDAEATSARQNSA